MKSKERLEFINIGILNVNLVVYKGRAENLIKHLNKNKEASRWLYRNVSSFDVGNAAGAVIYRSDDRRPLLVFLETPYTEESFLHEVVHLVDRFSQWGGFENEPEFRANLYTHLHRIIKKI